MTLLASTAVADIRQLSSLMNNNLFSDQQIVKLFNDGAGEIYDYMVGQFETWFLTSVDFTLAGGIGGNIFAMPMDKLLKDNTLERNPTQNTPDPVPRLGTWSDRNRTWGYGSGVGCGRRYYPAGSNLMVFPPNLAQGDYRLWYTPKYIPIAITSLTPVSVTASTHDWTFTNSAFTAADVGNYLVVTGASHAGNNGTFLITAVNDLSNVATANATTLADETFAAGVVITEQNPFNVAMEPWYLYPEVHAAIAIRTSRQQDTSDLQPKLAQLKARIATATANRTEEVPQTPLRDGFPRWGQNYFGGG